MTPDPEQERLEELQDEIDGVVERENGESELEPGEPAEPHRRTAKRLERHSRDTAGPAVPTEPAATRPETDVGPTDTG
jgi:hypothetical protein